MVNSHRVNAIVQNTILKYYGDKAIELTSNTRSQQDVECRLSVATCCWLLLSFVQVRGMMGLFAGISALWDIVTELCLISLRFLTNIIHVAVNLKSRNGINLCSDYCALFKQIMEKKIFEFTKRNEKLSPASCLHHHLNVNDKILISDDVSKKLFAKLLRSLQINLLKASQRIENTKHTSKIKIEIDRRQ